MTSASLPRTGRVRTALLVSPFLRVAALTVLVAVAPICFYGLTIAVLELGRDDPRALWVPLVPLAGCAAAAYAYTRERRSRRHFEFLCSSLRAIQSAPTPRLATSEVLQAARKLVSANVAELLLVPPDGSLVTSRIDGKGERLLEAIEPSEATERALATAALAEHPILLPKGREPHELDSYLEERKLREAIVVPLRSHAGLSGMLLIGGRAGFTPDDCKLLETFAGHVTAVLEHGQAREQLQYQAHHDDLTGLANRTLFTARCAASLGERASGRRTVVLFLDLDDFKTINDSLGHSAGDELLVAVADRIRACAGPKALAARLGGDEFALLLPSATLHEAESLAAAVLTAFESPIMLHGREFRIHPSIGIAAAQDRETTAEELLRNADVAMYSAKDGGKRRFSRYEPDMLVRARRRQELASDLERAIEERKIGVHYQPILELGTGRLFALEALARWEHPEHGVVSPATFVALAEETGLIGAIGRIVRLEACEQLARWRAALPDLPDLSVTVNLAPAELQNHGLHAEVKKLLAETKVPPRHLILEMTESSAVQQPEVTIGHLRELRALGVRVALDDFGTGYSSLSHLRDLPLDVIKIAKPFVDGLTGSRTAELLLAAILQISQALQLEVIAEGIEQRAQAQILERLGCRLVQGYLYSRPLTPDIAGGYLRGVPRDGALPVATRAARLRRPVRAR